MKYEEFLHSPEVHRAFDNMFEEQRKYYRTRSKDYGLMKEDAEVISIKLANISTDIYFTFLFNNSTKEKIIS